MTATIEQLLDLAERLGKATGPDRELDALLTIDLRSDEFMSGGDNNTTSGHVYAHTDGKPYKTVPSDRLTASIDAALALVERRLPGWLWMVRRCDPAENDFFAHVTTDPVRTQHSHFTGRGPTPALAILRALVSALISQAEGGAQ